MRLLYIALLFFCVYVCGVLLLVSQLHGRLGVGHVTSNWATRRFHEKFVLYGIKTSVSWIYDLICLILP